jgi:sulfite reductase alpha subunit-like flavoprotein
LNLIQTKVKKYFGERIVVDKKMKEHRWSYRKYNIILDDNHQYTDDESVKIICNNDFEEIRRMIKGLKNDSNDLMVEFNGIKMEINEQKEFFNYLTQLSFD